MPNGRWGTAVVCGAMLAAVASTSAAASCEPGDATAPREISLRTLGPRERALALDCGAARAEAIYGDRAIFLSAHDANGKMIEPDAAAFTLFRPLIERIVAERPETSRWTLFVREYGAFGPRLTAAAAADRNWDSRHRRPRDGRVSGYVINLANRAHVFEEIARLAAESGLKARVSSVEKVMLCPSPTGERGRFPCGASIWFALEK